MNQYNEAFRAFLNEAQFTKEMLGTGATQIRKANYATKGIYYQAFTSLSTGLERIGKICIILDYYIKSHGNFPDFEYMKRNIGHDIDLIYDKSIEIIGTRAFKFEFLSNLDTDVHRNILKVLTEFAKGDRYSNINILVNSKQKGDPIQKWYETVDKVLFERCISSKKKERILRNAEFIHLKIQSCTYVNFLSEEGRSIESVKEASLRTGLQEAIASYRQLYVLQIIRFWVELICCLQHEAMKLGKEDIPYMSEVFGLFYNSDSYIKTRKTWDTI